MFRINIFLKLGIEFTIHVIRSENWNFIYQDRVYFATEFNSLTFVVWFLLHNLYNPKQYLHVEQIENCLSVFLRSKCVFRDVAKKNRIIILRYILIKPNVTK